MLSRFENYLRKYYTEFYAKGKCCFMNARDQVSFYDSIKYMNLEDLDKILGILLKKEMTSDVEEKLKLIDIAIKYKQRRKDYFDKL